MQKLVKLPEGCPVHYHNIQHLRSQFSNLWMSIIPILPHLKLKKLLLFLNDNILPYMQEPEILITFLTDAYKSGGVCGILALDSLFCLMRNFNINVPDFYDHLYALLDEKILTSPYREMFLRSFSLFMTSTMLPAYVVAAMIKKLSRLLLAAPPNAIVWVIPFIYNMMKRYPACRIMIHRENENIQVDPYKFYATSISDCNALESCLWEILALENHYWHRIARLPKIFREKFTKPEYNLEDILDGLEAASSIDGVKDELSHRWSKKPPITLEVPNIAFY